METNSTDEQIKNLISQIKQGLNGLKKKDVCEKAKVSPMYFYNLLNISGYEKNVDALVRIVDAIIELHKEKKKKVESSAKKLQTINQ